MPAEKLSILSLYLVQHGETETNGFGSHTYCCRHSLTSKGERNARALAVHLRSVPFTRVLCSPQLPARQTCVIMELDCPSTIDSNLDEWTRAEQRDHFQYWASSRKYANSGNHTEDSRLTRDRDAVIIRADKLISQLNEIEGNIALFSHQNFAEVLTARWMGRPVASSQWPKENEPSIRVLTCKEKIPEVKIYRILSESERRSPAIEAWENEGGIFAESGIPHRRSYSEMTTGSNLFS